MSVTVVQARRRYLVLHALRWLPAGLLLPVSVLLMLSRGLSLADVGLVTAVQGLVVLALELPTGGLADALGRRPVLLAAGALNLGSLVLLATADSLPQFVLYSALQGAFRALDSGPLDSWYVDAALRADPNARIEGGLSGAGAVLGLAIAAGALGASGLVALFGRLALPVLVAAVVQGVAIVAVAGLLTEARSSPGLRSAGRAVREVPRVIASGLGLLRRSRILVALLGVELLWGFGLVAFETLTPPRLAETVGDANTAAAILGPAGSAAWLASALGAGLVPLLTRVVSAPVAAALLRVMQGATVALMGLLAGPVGLVAAYIGTYVIHGAANPVHQGLLHRQVDGPYRTTVLSLNSLVAQPAGAIGAIVLTAVADAASVRTAMLVGAVVIAAAAPLYLPARRSTPAVARLSRSRATAE